ncbi:MAG: PQQ-dependent sugar dehydrogenase [Candidatus Thermoplasmatota archaeon]|nr:PQQ-dependent sugar dehydrogenase [Candidatus Thermoplasmatota archaeon]
MSSTLDIEVITGGIGVQAVLFNTGTQNLTNISWDITLTGGLVLLGKTANGKINLLRPGRTTTIEIPLLVGFGKPVIRVTATAAEGDAEERTRTARLTGVWVTILPGDEEALTLRLERVAQNLKAPTTVTGSGDDSGRLFVAEQTGVIKIIQDGEVLSTPFLDLSDKVVQLNSFYDERGLLGLAFHPNYSANGRFFVYYSAPKTGDGIDHESIIAEYLVSADPNIADPSSENIIMRIDQPEANHNGGQLAFGPDGYLYIGVGDGGGAGDRHGDIGNGQDINTTLGTILRIDVDQGSPYGIPPDNPFVGIHGLDEIYAYGFRNPYRFSFDAVTGELFVADVGQDLREEIDVVVNGGNYGWRILEGTYLYDPDLAVQLGIDPASLEAPIHEYSHALGRSVIGGYVYRGTASPNLIGKYVFGDWSSGFVPGRGKLFYLEETAPDTWIRVEFNLVDQQPLKRYITGFGEDDAGEIYMVTTRLIGSLGTSGEVWHLIIE